MFSLAYIDEEDRAYGLAGMAVAAAALDAIDRIDSVSLDTDGPMVLFSNDFFFSNSPAVSPKAVWNNMLHNFYITSSLIMSNVMARSLVRRGRDVPKEALDRILKEMTLEGSESCSLDEDEVESLYLKCTTGMRRIFANRLVHPAIREFAHTLSQRRTLSAPEILDELHSLRLI